MALSDTKLKNLEQTEKSYQLVDGRGLFIEINPGGNKTCPPRYPPNGRQKKITLGQYPAYISIEDRQRSEQCRTMVVKRKSPIMAKRDEKAALKIRGDKTGQVPILVVRARERGMKTGDRCLY